MSLPILSYATARTDPSAFIQQLQHALLTTGFFYLSDIDAVLSEWKSAWDDAFSASAAFFAQPVEVKQEIGMIKSRHFRGYSAYGVEVTQGKRDLREQIDFGPEMADAARPRSDDDPLELSLYGPNQYPASTPTLEPAIRRWRNLNDTIARDLVSLLAQSLTPHPERIVDIFLPSSAADYPAYSRMKVVQYPPIKPGEEGAGVGSHKDGGGITLLAQDQTGGLQVQTWEGEWVGVEPVPYALVINVGQVMSVLVFPPSARLQSADAFDAAANARQAVSTPQRPTACSPRPAPLRASQSPSSTPRNSLPPCTLSHAPKSTPRFLRSPRKQKGRRKCRMSRRGICMRRFLGGRRGGGSRGVMSMCGRGGTGGKGILSVGRSGCSAKRD